MNSIDDFHEVCQRAARQAGAVLLDWAGRFSVREKGPADLVTEADLAAQEVVHQVVLGAFPRHGFLAEENVSIPSRDDGYRWVVDPLDGTTNYVHGIPCYATSIALERHGELIVGTVYDPVADACFSAGAGKGAFLNERRLSVSPVTELSRAVVALSMPPQLSRETLELQQSVDVALRVQSTRRMGSSALNLCYVAAGRFDAYWSQSTKLWDIAAGILLVQEAGGVVTRPDGGPFRPEPPHFVAAATSPLHTALRELLFTG